MRIVKCISFVVLTIIARKLRLVKSMGTLIDKKLIIN